MTLILYLFITIFTVYYIILACTSIKQERKIRDKYTSKDANLCIIIYASGQAGTLEYLIRQLKNQTYLNERYVIYVILDKVENPPEFIFQTDLGINVININNLEPIGKSQAYSIMAEKLSEAPNLDAYVFMDAKNYVDSDFLENINFYLTKYPVFMPNINYIGEDKEITFWNNVRITYAKYISKFIYNTRTRLGLTNLLNTNTFIIKRDLLNKISSFDFQDKIAETNYTFKLAQENISVGFINDVRTYREVENFDLRIPSLSKRCSIFWQNWNKCVTFKAFEYIASLLSPNWLVCLLVYSYLLSHTFHFGGVNVLGIFEADFTLILISFILLILAFCTSLLHANIYARENLYLFAYPIYSIGHIVHNFPPIRSIRNFIKNKNRKHNIEKMLTDAIVTDGKNEYPCKLEFISDDGLARVKFINKSKTYTKTYTTKNNHLRMVDAIKELSQKLNDYGLSLKICQNCRHFQPIVDGSTNMVKGNCRCKFEGRIDGDIIPTLIWNTCPNFEKENVVNLF